MNWIKTFSGRTLHKNLPIIIDSLRVHPENVETEIKGNWYIAKTLNASYFSLCQRVFHAYLVLTKKAFAVQYAEDHIKCYEKYYESSN